MNDSWRHVLILGLGSSGLAAAELALRFGRRVTVLDGADSPELRDRADLLEARGAGVRLEWNEAAGAPEADVAVISPGIPPGSPLGRLAAASPCPVISELEFGYRHCACPVVAITGTNGKTTTTEMTVRALRHSGKRVEAAGNIGVPLSEAVRRSQGLDLLVVEASSFQLERIPTFAPLAAAFLNFAPDHLDRYENETAYLDAKLHLFDNMRRGQSVILSDTAWNRPAVRARIEARGLIPRLFSVSPGAQCEFGLDAGALIRRRAGKTVRLLDLQAARAPGRHNAANLLAALALCEASGAAIPRCAEALRDFVPGRHRLELAAVHEGVRFVNDSKSTNPDSLRCALECLGRERRRILLIAGGLDKGLDFRRLRPLLHRWVREVFLVGRCRNRLAKQWNDVVSCKVFASFAAAVDAAVNAAGEDDVVLLSPGCSSQDMFANYAERGEIFCDLVKRRIGE